MKCLKCGKVEPNVVALHVTDAVCDDCVVRDRGGLTKAEAAELYAERDRLRATMTAVIDQMREAISGGESEDQLQPWIDQLDGALIGPPPYTRWFGSPR